ncbi:hypothetical protein [Streptomyces flavofungini]|uniref:Uncharacterized protein n=1 Tax=Streptomyces flavofungini TaxID=68200 RepID=A0ABS0XIA1_9ACTN|nr:hypothetical protein [Streptomyces flavofungini]MBJ3812947.1 hypothetical protein [Streptomyces flavofungini]GHC84468.1 hypothetical protein GCM10010349_69530 [Streptomyces flavofungini]
MLVPPENRDPANLRAMRQGCHPHDDREHRARTLAETRHAKPGASGRLEFEPYWPRSRT